MTSLSPENHQKHQKSVFKTYFFSIFFNTPMPANLNKNKQSESVLSIKSQNSCSKTNSSSFQQDFFQKKIADHEKNTKKIIEQKKNFKKKNKQNKITFLECSNSKGMMNDTNKIRKSLSNNKFDKNIKNYLSFNEDSTLYS
jgi:hypothetical protein